MSKYYLGFLYEKISVPKVIMSIWVSYAPFREKIKYRIDNNLTIDNWVVYNIIKTIYFPIRKERENGKIIKHPNPHQTLRGVRFLCKELYNDREYWQKEYQEYIDKIAN